VGSSATPSINITAEQSQASRGSGMMWHASRHRASYAALKHGRHLGQAAPPTYLLDGGQTEIIRNSDESTVPLVSTRQRLPPDEACVYIRMDRERTSPRNPYGEVQQRAVYTFIYVLCMDERRTPSDRLAK
jgi:hypothetical protein